MTQENKTNISNILVIIGLLIMLVMALLPLININLEWMRWAFATGAGFVLIARFMETFANRDAKLRIKRLHHILALSAILYCVSASMMFLSRGSNDWLAFLLAGLVTQVYASWMIEREAKKTEK